MWKTRATARNRPGLEVTPAFDDNDGVAASPVPLQVQLWQGLLLQGPKQQHNMDAAAAAGEPLAGSCGPARLVLPV